MNVKRVDTYRGAYETHIPAKLFKIEEHCLKTYKIPTFTVP